MHLLEESSLICSHALHYIALLTDSEIVILANYNACVYKVRYSKTGIECMIEFPCN